MTSHVLAAVWLDHHEAKIFHVDQDGFDETSIQSPHHHVHRHPKPTEKHEHPEDQRRFFEEVAGALKDAAQVLVLGPSTAKLHFVRHVHQHDRALEPKIVGIETVDHPTDGQLVAYVKRYFQVPAATPP